MGTKRKHIFPTWTEAEAAVALAESESRALKIALRELVLGKVKWLEDQWRNRRVGLCQLDDSHGGVVILADRFVIDATWLDSWAKKILDGTAPPTDKKYMPAYKTWLDVRRLATKALALRELANDKAADSRLGCTRLPLASEVDQSVRQY